MAEIRSGNYQHQIVQSYDEASESLKTTITNADVNINVSAFTDSIKIGDGSGDTATITEVGPKKALDVNVADITISAANDSIALGDGVNLVGLTQKNELKAAPATLMTRLDEFSATVTYIGKASPGTAASAASWQLQRITESGSELVIEFADGDENFNKVWNNRLSLSYS